MFILRHFKFNLLRFFYFVVAALCSVYFTGIGGEEFSDVPKQEEMGRTVFIKLSSKTKEKYPEAIYQIQVRPIDEKMADQWKEPMTLTVEDLDLRLRLTPSKYAIRTRAITPEGQYGLWGKWKDFWVHHRVPTQIYPGLDQTILPMDDTEERMTFEWPEVAGAKAYMISVRNSQNVVVKKMTTRQNWARIQLPVGQKYNWQVQPISFFNETDYVEMKENNYIAFNIAKPDKDGKKTINFNAGVKSRVKKYQFEIVKNFPNQQTSNAALYESYESDFKVRLGPGTYDMRARYVYKNGITSEWSPPRSFYVKLPPLIKISPVTGTKIDPVDDEKNLILFKWQANPLADRYRLKVFFKETGETYYQEVENPYATMALPHNQDYIWDVEAYNVKEKIRKPAAVETTPAGENFTVEKFNRLNLSTAEESGQWYGWSRYMMSNVQMKAKNFDQATLVTQTIYQDIGEVASGYWLRGSNYGVMGHASQSTFRDSNQRGVTNTAGLHVGYRNKENNNYERFRGWLGVTYREFPEVIGNLETLGYRYSKISTTGLQAQMSYLNSINKTWGYHGFAEAYLSLKGTTPNNNPLTPKLAFKVGAYATYRLQKDWMAMIGYAFNHEEMAYKSNFRKGNDNSLVTDGSYLSFILETSLGNTSNK